MATLRSAACAADAQAANKAKPRSFFAIPVSNVVRTLALHDVCQVAMHCRGSLGLVLFLHQRFTHLCNALSFAVSALVRACCSWGESAAYGCGRGLFFHSQLNRNKGLVTVEQVAAHDGHRNWHLTGQAAVAYDLVHLAQHLLQLCGRDFSLKLSVNSLVVSKGPWALAAWTSAAMERCTAWAASGLGAGSWGCAAWGVPAVCARAAVESVRPHARPASQVG